MKTTLEEQRVQVEAAVSDVTVAVEEMRKGEAEVRDEMREIRSEVNNMQEMLPKVCYPPLPPNAVTHCLSRCSTA